MPLLEPSHWKYDDVPIIIGVNVATTLALLLVARLSFRGPTQGKIFRSPRENLLPKLTAKETNDLPYPPDVLPGRREVNTPYGVINVYEFGPETGRKVLFVHGISTPCISLGAVAHGLVDKGCRVMLFDLWGRGYSDAPADLAHDNRLYASQIMFVMTSSELQWNKFDLIGYSLGGGISADFASYFPRMINSLALLAPAGLIRPQHIAGFSKFLYSSGIFPEGLLQYIAKRRLLSGPVTAKAVGKKASVTAAAITEASSPSSQVVLSRAHPNVALLSAVRWQTLNNPGFVNSFMSSIRYAPITGQQATWKRIGLSLSEKTTPQPEVLHKKKLLIMAGRTDPVIIAEELKEDIYDQLGEPELYQWEVVDGDHNFPSQKSAEVLRILGEFWGL